MEDLENMGTSYESALWQALILYLEAQAVGLSTPDKPVTFAYFSDIHTPNQSPQGAIFLNTIERSPIGQLDYQSKLAVSFSIRLLVSFNQESIDNFLVLADLQSWLTRELNDLRSVGRTGVFRDQILSEAFIGCELYPVNIALNVNQDKGFTGIISTKLTWETD